MKTEMKHTKGAWDHVGHIIFSEETNDEIAWIKSLSAGASRAHEAEANAKLIAAAPDLLEACISVYKCSGEKGVLTKPVLDSLLNSINKATL